MKVFWREYKEIIQVLRMNLSRFIKYQIATKLLLGIILVPFFNWCFNSLMRSKGYSYITNGLVKKFLISPQGLLLVILGIAFALVVVLIDLGGLIVLSYQALNKKEESSFYQIAKYSIQKIKYLAGLDGLFIVFYLMLIAPMIDSNLKTSILKQLKIPGFIMDVILSKTSYTVYLSLAIIIFVVLSIRWMFSIHVIMLSDNKEKHAFRKSGKLVERNIKYIFKRSLGINLINLIILVILILLSLLVSIALLSFTKGEYVEVVVTVLFSIGLLILFAASFIITPFQILLLTKLYINIQDEPIPDIKLEGNKKRNFIDKIIVNKTFLIIICVMSIVVTSFFVYVFYEVLENTKYNVDITAHRGSSKDAPENTLAAIDAAISNGASYAEIDVQETKDGKIILLHDKSFLRTTGVNKSVWEVTLEEVKDMDAGSIFDESFKGERIPTLEEVIEHSNGRIKLNIEIKTNGHESNLVGEVVRIIKEKELIDACVVTSLNYEALEMVEKLEPRIKTGYIMFIAIGDLEKLNVDFYSVEESNVNDKFVEKAHSIGREVHVWTINTRESMENVLKLGVDNIITDNDKMLSDLIRDKNQ
ncbi:glycerophosphodiester phosphodiesterase [Wukongibacter baidiensis]|uniref:glycerophosphoryl diester phosphodiesterase membrane domain-containing protein n=1 Tax=Wukongibacter baidiensis TaxID=1723361 RepID=UPI003D7FF94E